MDRGERSGLLVSAPRTDEEWGSCVRCGRVDPRGEFVELLGTPTPGNPDGGTGDPICPACIAEDMTDAEKARELLEADDHGLRVAYEHYIANAPWVPFERFEMGVQILSEESPDDQPEGYGWFTREQGAP